MPIYASPAIGVMAERRDHEENFCFNDADSGIDRDMHHASEFGTGGRQ